MNTKEVGRQVLTGLMGAEYVANKDKTRNEFNGVLHDYAEEVCFGRTWARPGIDHKMRSILNVAMLTALNRPGALKSHVEGALNNGCTREELLPCKRSQRPRALPRPRARRAAMRFPWM